VILDRDDYVYSTSGPIGISGFAGTSGSLDPPESASGLHRSAIIPDDVIPGIPDIADVEVTVPSRFRVPSFVLPAWHACPVGYIFCRRFFALFIFIIFLIGRPRSNEFSGTAGRIFTKFSGFGRAM